MSTTKQQSQNAHTCDDREANFFLFRSTLARNKKEWSMDRVRTRAIGVCQCQPIYIQNLFLELELKNEEKKPITFTIRINY